MSQDVAVSATASQLESVKLEDNTPLPFGKETRKQFQFADNFVNLNHGSFGTYPRPIRSELLKFQEASEAQPDQFIRYDYPNHLEASRHAVSKVINADVDNVVFVPNATMGVNTILRSLRFEPGDKIVYFNFIYGACGKTIEYIEESTSAKGVRIDINLPCEAKEIVRVFRETILAAGPGLLNEDGQVEEKKPGQARVKIAVFDTIVSLPGVRLPFEELVKVCKDLGVMSLIDGAHGIGHIPLDMTALDPDFFVSNCHKWLFVPRGCAVLYVPKRHQHLITSIPTSHGFIPSTLPSAHPNPLPPSPTPKSPWVSMFEFVGTIDNSPYLCLPAAISYRQNVLGGEARITNYIQSIARRGAQIIADMLGTDILDDASHSLTQCALQNIRLPLGTRGGEGERYIGAAELEGKSETYVLDVEKAAGVTQYLQRTMTREFGTFIPVILYRGNWFARVSGQVYLDEEDFRFGGRVLKELVERVRNGEGV